MSKKLKLVAKKKVEKVFDGDPLNYTTANGILFSGCRSCLKIRINNYKNLYLKDIAAALAEFIQWHTIEIRPTLLVKSDFKKHPPIFIWMD
jgi:hypothetical protein